CRGGLFVSPRGWFAASLPDIHARPSGPLIARTVLLLRVPRSPERLRAPTEQGRQACRIEDRQMNDLTPIEMTQLEDAEDADLGSRSQSRRRLMWIVPLVVAVALAWYLLRGDSAPAAVPPPPVVTVATPLQQEVT